MSVVTYRVFVSPSGRPNVVEKEIEVNFERPSWWADARKSERKVLEAKVTLDSEVQKAYAKGFIISGLLAPVCECVVQQFPRQERDPYLLGAGHTCKRCGGPLT